MPEWDNPWPGSVEWFEENRQDLHEQAIRWRRKRRRAAAGMFLILVVGAAIIAMSVLVAYHFASKWW